MPTNLPAHSKKQNKTYYAFKHPNRDFIIFSKSKTGTAKMRKNHFRKLNKMPSGWSWFENKNGMILPKKQ